MTNSRWAAVFAYLQSADIVGVTGKEVTEC